ncbi:Tim44 domain-containing protein [Acinetobacter pollinis]|uniref:Tim44 domain-containing protein n=1 Tax=Acinetobacter pollinis TaxID=2605270 RepID=UPI0018A24DC2|nr:Tim44-like domain-containing protein [Acinetobacter pollinis]MBF7690514.1 Tim44 domain-containing protein [Acinetobacter pollinis]MBF7697998.1 Tim44 domain-containing protein [Acinetobacter pollinis]
MKLRQRGLVASILIATLVVSPLVDAKRAGNGKSQGMQRSIAPSQSSQQQQRVRPQPAPTYNNTAPQPQQKQGSGIGKMVAAGAAGAAVGALATHALADNNHNNATNNANTGTATANEATATQNTAPQQQAEQPAEKKSGGLPWLWIILIAGAAFFIFRKMSAKKKSEGNNNPYAPNNGSPSFGSNSTTTNTSNNDTNIFGQSVGGGTNMNTQAPFTNNGNQLPDGTEQAAFLRVARQRFNHIQSINSASNIEEIRRYLTNDLYNSMYQDIMANQEQDVAEFENLTATLVDSTTENGQYIASVRFTGMVSEDLNSTAKPFSEVWHFVKPVNSQQDWIVAGIQVEN